MSDRLSFLTWKYNTYRPVGVWLMCDRAALYSILPSVVSRSQTASSSDRVSTLHNGVTSRRRPLVGIPATQP